MNILLNIAFDSEIKLSHDISDNTFTITFNSFEEYYKFLKNPTPLKVIGWNDEGDKYIYKRINNNLDKFTQHYLKKQTIYVTGATPTSDIPLEIDQPLEIDLSNLSLAEELKLLNQRSWDNITFYDKYNTYHPVKKEELLKSYKQVYEMANKYKKYNLSPLEVTLIAFDLIRARAYKENEKNKVRSRDLIYILENPEIVCLGYVRLFQCFCEFLGVKTDTLLWFNRLNMLKNGHASLLTYIDDDKYDVKGIFAFEPTWASIKPKTEETYMNDYRFALQPLNIEISRKKVRNLELDSDNLLCIIHDNLRILESLVELDGPETIIENSKRLLLTKINSIREKINKEPLEMPKGNDISSFKLMIEFLKSPIANNINLETFRKLIETVRSIENEIDPKTYKNDKETIDAAVASYISYHENSELNNLIQVLFGDSRTRKKS